VRLVVAIGRSVLFSKSAPPADRQTAAVRDLARRLAVLAATHELVLAFGSGPQLGLLTLEGAAQAHQVEVNPGELVAAHGELTLVYLLEQELRALLPADRVVASVLTTATVDPSDEAFASPDASVGPSYLRVEARQLSRQKGWTFQSDVEQCRRVVARPAPQHIAELRAITRLLDAGAVVIAAGGAGLPVSTTADRSRLDSIGCLVDADLVAARLARDLDADMLVMLAEGDAVYLDWGTPWQRAIRRASPDCLSERLFHTGSIAGKIAAACRFAADTGRAAAIGAAPDVDKLLSGTAGTTVSKGETALVMAETSLPSAS
jgi:carbamate kinase